jgi:thiamine-phosphate pyrophosphorylase
LEAYPAPPAWGVYLVTDRARTNGRPLVDVVGAALRGGIRAVQLRERDLATRELLALGETLRRLTRAAGAALLINDRIDIALAVAADGVHLPGHSFSVAEARALLGPRPLVGVSSHCVDDVVAAEAAGADFTVFGPLYDTPAKRAYGLPLGLVALSEARARVSLPLLGIGGIDAARAGAVCHAGADGVAVIRAILGAGDPCTAAAALLRAVAPRIADFRSLRS